MSSGVLNHLSHQSDRDRLRRRKMKCPKPVKASGLCADKVTPYRSSSLRTWSKPNADTSAAGPASQGGEPTPHFNVQKQQASIGPSTHRAAWLMSIFKRLKYQYFDFVILGLPNHNLGCEIFSRSTIILYGGI